MSPKTAARSGLSWAKMNANKSRLSSPNSSWRNQSQWLSLSIAKIISPFCSNLVRHSAARVIAAIASIEVPKGSWADLLPFLQQTCVSPTVAHREVGSYILFTVLESIVEGFQSQLNGLFSLFSNLLKDPESLEVRITTVRALGVIAQYIDADDKAELKSFQALLPSMIQVIGQSVEAGNENAARQLFDVLETLLILVRSDLFRSRFSI